MMDLNKIQLDVNPLPRDLFSEIALQAAKYISQTAGKNTTSQIRKFYDELVMWRDKVYRVDRMEDREKIYRSIEPFIQMLQAKVAYAKGRGLVDENFECLFRHMIKEIKSINSLNHAKLFFEAVLGFRKGMEGKK